jgi:hypothetical protein
VEPECSLQCSQEPTSSEILRSFYNKLVVYDEVLAPRSTAKQEDYLLSAVYDWLFDISVSWTRLLHPQPEDAPCRGDRNPHNVIFNDFNEYTACYWSS